MANLTDADKVLRNDVGKDIASKLNAIASAITNTSALSGLSDVALATLTDGQVIIWNATNQKWENTTLPEPMIFRGSLGVGGTITTLPTDGTARVGDTYKVITDGTYAGQVAKVGDTFICLTKTSVANTWAYIPSGDEPSGTVTSIKIEATSPIVVDDDSAVTTSGIRTLSHANSGATAGSYGDSSAQTPAYGATFKVPYITVDAKGHITGISEHTVKIPDSDNTDTASGISYDPTTSGLSATNAQDAIDELRELDPQVKTASGSIATFSNGGDDIPVSEYECEIVAQQASGTPTPASPLPITGFSQADIVGCGKNRLNLADKTTTIGSYVIDNENVPMVAGYYVLSFDFSGTSNSSSLRIDDEDGTAIFTTTKTIIVGRNEFLINLPSKGAFVKLFSNAIGTYTNFQIELGETTTTYEAYNGNTYVIEFGQTIYGGRLIYKNGQWSIEATHGYIDLGDLTYTKTTDYDYTFFKGSSVNNKGNNTLCSCYKPVNLSRAELNDNEVGLYNTYGANQPCIRDDSKASLTPEQFKSAVNGQLLTFELATPTIIPITSSTRVKTISGVNNIFSNTGDCEVKYFTDGSDPIVDIIEQVSYTKEQTDAEINEVRGTFVTGTLTAGSTSLTLSDASITTTSTIDIYVSAFGIQPVNAVVSTGSITLTFLAQASDIAVKVRVS